MDLVQAINEAYEAFHIATTPDALREAVRASIEAGRPQTEDDIVWSAGTLLQEAIHKAIELHDRTPRRT